MLFAAVRRDELTLIHCPERIARMMETLLQMTDIILLLCSGQCYFHLTLHPYLRPELRRTPCDRQIQMHENSARLVFHCYQWRGFLVCCPSCGSQAVRPNQWTSDFYGIMGNDCTIFCFLEIEAVVSPISIVEANGNLLTTQQLCFLSRK